MPSTTILQGLSATTKFLLSTVTLTLMLATTSHAELVIQPSRPNISPELASIALAKAMPSDASTTKLMQVFHIDEMIDSLIAQRQQMAEGVKALPNTLPMTESNSVFSKKTNQQIQKVFEKYRQVFAGQFDSQQSRQQMQQAYRQAVQKHYTQAEVEALIGFYDTPMGQQILPKQSLVTQDFMQIAMPSMMGNSEALQKVLPNLGQDIEKIFQ
ncbi:MULTISPECIES: DUF2059 domain-containing protein [unclassified Moraxella]|uniref:DUF2059 domain-containing protein n=1 Tax=unclassified Moraxella TaxID=2685852 RepID=UPI003AF77E59